MPQSYGRGNATPQTQGQGSHSVPGDDANIATELFKAQDKLRSDTPETLLTEFTNRPDITILCEQCSIYIDIRSLIYHRTYHDALTLLQYVPPTKPTTVALLLERRNAVLQQMKEDATEEKPLRFHDVTKIDEAYELLKSDLEDIYEEIKQVNERIEANVGGVSLNCSPDCAYAIGMCCSENNRWKSYMEDMKVYQDYFGDDRNKCYLAIFDGYHGVFAAERSANEFHHLLLHEMAKFDSKTKSTLARNFAESTTAQTDYEMLRPETRDSFRVNLHQDSAEIVQGILDLCNEKYEKMMNEKDGEVVEESTEKKKKKRNPMSDKMRMAFKKTYYLMDILLSYGKDERSRVRWSGTSACTVVIQNTKKSGDTEGKDDELSSLDEEISGSEGKKVSAHRKNQPKELGLIHLANAGNTRALLVRDNKPYRLTKDHTPKNTKERERVLKSGGTLSISERDCRVNGVLSVTRGLGNHGDKKLKDCVVVDPHVTTVPIDQYAQFLVLASKGVWEIFSDEEVTSLLVKMLPSEQIPAPSRICDSLLPLLNEKQEDSGRHSSGVSNKSNDGSKKQRQSSGRKVSFPSLAQDNDVKQEEKSSEEKENEEVKESGEEKKDDEKVNPNEKETNTLVIVHDDAVSPGTMNVLADLHTEIGSRMSDGGDDRSLQPGQDSRGWEDQFLTMPAHSNIPESMPQTEDELRRELAKSMAEQLTQAALMAGAKDNVTCMVVLLPACGI